MVVDEHFWEFQFCYLQKKEKVKKKTKLKNGSIFWYYLSLTPIILSFQHYNDYDDEDNFFQTILFYYVGPA